MRKQELTEQLNKIKELETLLYNNSNDSDKKKTAWKFRRYRYSDGVSDGEAPAKERKFSQRDIIASLLNGDDTISILPTAGGKTMCFQTPALCAPGITIVISPLKALYMEQTSKFNKKYCDDLVTNKKLYDEYRKTGIGKDLNEALPRAIYPGLDEQCYGKNLFKLLSSENRFIDRNNEPITVDYKILYLTPERLSHGKFYRMLINAVKYDGLFINSLVIDEAHLLSQWSFDFRETYLNIIEFLNVHEKITGRRLPVSCFTATATTADVMRMKTLLKMKRPKEFICRELNEKISVSIECIDKKVTKENQEISEGFDSKLKSILFGEDNEGFNKCIVFCNNKRKVEKLEKNINKWGENTGTKCVMYHAGMSPKDRQDNQDRFSRPNDDVTSAQIMVCTVAFGIGTEVGDVDLVVHLGLTSTIEEYIQEMGRCGRKGEGRAILIYKRDGVSIPGSSLNVARTALKWELNLPPRSPINRLNDDNKDLLKLLKVYRASRCKELIEYCISLGDKEDVCSEMYSIVRKYFEEDISDANFGSVCAGYLDDYVQATSDNYKELLSAIEASLSVLGKSDRDKRKKLEKRKEKVTRYIEECKSAQLKSKDTIGKFYSSDSKARVEGFYDDLGKIIEVPKVFKVNNTSVANKLRTEEIKLGIEVEYEETESKVKTVKYIETKSKDKIVEDKRIKNINIFKPTAFTTITNEGEEYPIEYINEEYGDKTDTDYLYVIKKEAKIDKYIVKYIFYREDNRWVLLKEDEELSGDNEIVAQHLGCTLDGVRLPNGVPVIAAISSILDSNLGSPWEVKKPIVSVDGQRTNKIEFELFVNKEECTEEKFIKHYHLEEQGNRVLNYLDMMILDCIYTLYYYGETKIYLQRIWEIMNGREGVKLSSHTEKKTTKERIENSIEKMGRLNIRISDSAFEPNGCEGKMLDYKKVNNAYVIQNEPVLFQYAEKANGRIMSLNLLDFDARLYFDVKSRVSSISHASLIHFVLHRIGKMHSSKRMGTINYDNMLQILGNELPECNRNTDYLKEIVEKIMIKDKTNVEKMAKI